MDNVLLTALDNENNTDIVKYTSSKLKSIKNDVLQQLLLPKEQLKDLHNKLKLYRYVDDLSNIHYGRYIRWINLKNPDNLKLTRGGIIIDIQILSNGIHVTCKNNMNRIFQIKIDENMIFQKLSDQEKTILSVMDYLDKK
tara:strand:+ start:205 stop:624 length:420 start_codon:yes stop_codon:yes gene_type:complete